METVKVDKVALHRVNLKRKLRLNGFASEYINNLDTHFLEQLVDKVTQEESENVRN